MAGNENGNEWPLTTARQQRPQPPSPNVDDAPSAGLSVPSATLKTAEAQVSVGSNPTLSARTDNEIGNEWPTDAR